MRYKQFICSIIIIIALLVMTSCRDGSLTNSPTGAEYIAGSYEAIVFTEPGQHDGGIDILESGGKLSVNLSANFKLEGHLMIPANIGSSFTPIDDDFTGTFELNSDTLYFKNTGMFFDHDPWMFILQGIRLETPDWTGWWSTTKIILEKK